MRLAIAPTLACLSDYRFPLLESTKSRTRSERRRQFRRCAIQKRGTCCGVTDEFGFRAVENRVSSHGLHGTLPHVSGIDHETLTYRYAGPDFRLTDVSRGSATICWCDSRDSWRGLLPHLRSAQTYCSFLQRPCSSMLTEQDGSA